MATRTNIAIFKEGEKDLTKFEVILYRHWDGNPKSVLPEITPVLGMLDLETPHDVAETLVKSDIGMKFTGSIHGDIDWFYAVYPNRIDVYQVRYGSDPEDFMLKQTERF